MKRAEFIELWCDTVDQGRCKNFPDMRPSERAFARIDDRNTGANQWRKYRHHWAKMTREEVLATITDPKPKPEVPSAS